jgi:hypothetical protein
VPQGVALIGVAHHLSVVLPAIGGFSGPLVHMQAPSCDDEGESVMSQLMLVTFFSTPGVSTWRWDAAAGSVRSVGVWIFRDLCENGVPHPSCPPKPWANRDAPLSTLRGAGRFWVLHYENGQSSARSGAATPSYRHLLIEGSTAGRRAFYHLNAEHAQSDAEVEVRDGGGADIYGMKSEGYFAVLWLRNATAVNLYGYGGNACPFTAAAGYPPSYAAFTPSLFRLDDSYDVRLVNLISWDMQGTLAERGAIAEGGTPNGVPCADPDKWISVVESQSGRNFSSASLDRPVYWRVGAHGVPRTSP